MSGSQHARVGALAVAIHLERVVKHEPKRNHQRAYERLQEIDPETITQLPTARILTIVPMTEKRWDDAAKFTSRWVELAREQDSEKALIDPVGLRQQASTEVTAALDVSAAGFEWDWILGPAWEQENWKLAEIVIRQQELLNSSASVDALQIRMYTDLLAAARTGDAAAVLRSIEEFDKRNGSLSTPLKRIRDAASAKITSVAPASE